MGVGLVHKESGAGLEQGIRRGKTPEKSRTRLSRRRPAVDVETGNENDGPIPGNGRTDT